MDTKMVVAEAVLAGRRAQMAVAAEVRATVLERRRERKMAERLARQQRARIGIPHYRRRAT